MPDAILVAALREACERTRLRSFDLAVFAYGGVTSETLHAVTGEFADALAAGADVALRSEEDALLSRARSATVARFLAGASDVLFMLDRDVRFRPGDVVRTAARALGERAIVGGLYACRAEGRGFSSVCEATKMAWAAGANVLHEARYLGGGFLAIPRGCAAQIVAADLPPDLRLVRCRLHDVVGTDLFRPVVARDDRLGTEAVYLSEDWSMSLRARAAGVPLYLWSLPVLGHVGGKTYMVRDALPAG